MCSPESAFDILTREPVEGGQVSSRKEKLRVRTGRERTLLLKRTSSVEVVALRAAGRVPEATAVPRLIGSGHDTDGDWIAIPYYAGEPAPTETDVPDEVVDTLAAVHAHYLGSGVPLPLRDAGWWAAACAQNRLRQLARPRLQPVVETVQEWSTRRSLLAALGELPRTLLHGDVHRNNIVIEGGTSGRLVDWAGAAYGLPAFDLVTPGPPGSRAYRRYAARWEALTGEPAASPAWQRGYLTATVCTKVMYLSFAARNFGDDAALRMFQTATDALAELERLGR